MNYHNNSLAWNFFCIHDGIWKEQLFVTTKKEVHALSKLVNAKGFVQNLNTKSEKIISINYLQNVMDTIEELKVVLLNMISYRIFKNKVCKHMREKVEDFFMGKSLNGEKLIIENKS